MARFTTHIRTPMPAEQAFAYMADLTNFAEWDPGVVTSTQVTGDSPGHGSEYDVEVNGIGGTLTLRYRITDYQEPTEFVAEARTHWLHSFDRITVTPSDDNGSIVSYDAELTLSGLLKIADPLLGIAFDRIGKKAEAGLAEALQGSAVKAS